MPITRLGALIAVATLTGCASAPAGPDAPELRLALALQEGDPVDPAGAHEAWMKAGTPGPPHELLATLNGEWKADSTFVPMPGMPPMKATFECDYEPFFGKRFLLQQIQGNLMGMAWKGRGWWGYDNIAKQYLAIWTDNMSTMVLVLKGTADDTGKIITVKGEYLDPMTGKSKSTRGVLTIAGDDKHEWAMYENAPDGTEYRTLHIVYTRTSDD